MAALAPVIVTYCVKCGLPPEFCEYNLEVEHPPAASSSTAGVESKLGQLSVNGGEERGAPGEAVREPLLLLRAPSVLKHWAASSGAACVQCAAPEARGNKDFCFCAWPTPQGPAGEEKKDGDGEAKKPKGKKQVKKQARPLAAAPR